MSRPRVEVCFTPNLYPLHIEDEYEINLISEPKEDTYDALVLAVSHQDFIDMGINEIRNLLKENHVIYDVKYLFDINEVDGRL